MDNSSLHVWHTKLLVFGFFFCVMFSLCSAKLDMKLCEDPFQSMCVLTNLVSEMERYLRLNVRHDSLSHIGHKIDRVVQILQPIVAIVDKQTKCISDAANKVGKSTTFHAEIGRCLTSQRASATVGAGRD